jgi:KDO2-lipid IV(A) lauroyltransferase
MVGNVALYLGLRAAALVLPALPARAGYALASFFGTCAYLLFPIPRRALAENLSHVLHAPSGSRAVQRAVRHAFQNDARNWVDTLRITRLTPTQILGAVEVDGWENLEAATAEGRGVVLATIHLGNFDLVGQVLAARGYRVTVPVERMTPEPLFRFLLKLRTSQGIRAIEARRAPRQMLSALKRGELVGVAADRGVGGKEVEVEFFGQRARVPRGAISLARHTGAPLVLGVGVRIAPGRFRGFVTEPMHLSRGQGGADEEEMARRLAHLMEHFILRYPDQWLMFSRVWEPTRDSDSAATMEHSAEAVV